MLVRSDVIRNLLCDCCRRLLFGIVLAAVLCDAAQSVDSETKLRQGDLHGPLEYLQNSLVLSAEDARLIAAAKRQLELGDNGLAFEALKAVFTHEHDSFTPISPGRASGSTYRLALELLQQADYTTRRDWSVMMEPLAAAMLNVSGDDSEAIDNVARFYPYTRSGMQAQAMRIMLARSRGQHQLAFAILADLDSQYANTAVSFDAQETLTALRTHLRATQRSDDSPRIAGGQLIDSPQRLTLPWPAPVWNWQETVWKFPQGIASFGALTQPSRRSTLAFNSWQPTLIRDSIILRTPFRVLAFDRKSGNVQWSVVTDTIGDSVRIEDSGPGTNFGRGPSTAELLQMDDLGGVSASDHFVFFIDHFRKLKAPGRILRRPDLQPLIPEERRGGTRLVAMQRHPVPRIAWTIGDAAEFDYRIKDKDQLDAPEKTPASQLKRVREETVTDPITPFKDQYFMGVPLVHDQMLFLLSADTETIWLNCLTEATGRLKWQVPVTYTNELQPQGRGRFITRTEQPTGASLCGVDGETVVCVLKTGVAIGVRLTDGRFEWATNVRGEDQLMPLQGRAAYMMRASTLQHRNFRPLLNDGRMYWSAKQSDEVYCVDTSDGTIVWHVSREADAFGTLEGSEDQYAVAVIGDRLILCGDRHIRAVSTKNGTQFWASYIPPQCGQATCNDKSCLVPLQNGSVAYVNLSDGRMNLVSQDVLADQTRGIIGTLVADEDFVYSMTPLTLAAYPVGIKDAVFNPPGEDVTPSRPSKMLMEAQAAVLSADLSSAVTLLQTVVDQQATVSDTERAQDLLKELLLRSIALRKFQPGNMNDEAVARKPQTLWPNGLTVRAALDVLRQLPLTSEQNLRLSVLTGEAPLPTEIDMIPPMLDLLPDWKSRGDVAAWSNLSSGIAATITPFSAATNSLLSAAEHATLFPQHVGDLQEQLRFSDVLRDRDFHAANELFLLAARFETANEDRKQLDARLNAVRGRLQSGNTKELSAGQRPTGFRVKETLHLSTNNRISELLNASFVPVDTPGWYGRRLFFGNRELFTVNMETGAVSTPFRLPTTPVKLLSEDNFESPGLLPLIGQQYVGMVSLVAADKPSLLWWRRFNREDFDVSALELGPFSSSFLIVATEHQIACLHPLTGNVLWTRNVATGSGSRNAFNRAVQYAGDEQVVGVFGENMKSCEVFRTRDGHRLGAVPLEIPDNSVPIISGRRVLFHKERQLHLVDLLSGQNILSDKPLPKILKGGTARVISNHRVVLMSEELEILVLNTQTGAVDLKCSVADELKDQKLTGLSVFERNNRLFVLAKNWGDPYSQRSASSRMGEFRLDHGRLFCIDAMTGEKLWNQITLPSVVPEIYGDPIDVMITWSWKDPDMGGFQQQLFGPRSTRRVGTERSMTLSVIDTATGKAILDVHHLSADEPVRCFHDGASKTITLEAETSKTTLTYTDDAQKK